MCNFNASAVEVPGGWKRLCLIVSYFAEHMTLGAWHSDGDRHCPYTIASERLMNPIKYAKSVRELESSECSAPPSWPPLQSTPALIYRCGWWNGRKKGPRNRCFLTVRALDALARNKWTPYPSVPCPRMIVCGSCGEDFVCRGIRSFFFWQFGYGMQRVTAPGDKTIPLDQGMQPANVVVYGGWKV